MRSWFGSLRNGVTVDNIAGDWHGYGRHTNSNFTSSGNSDWRSPSWLDHVCESRLINE